MKSDSFFLSKKGKEKSLTLFFPTWKLYMCSRDSNILCVIGTCRGSKRDSANKANGFAVTLTTNIGSLWHSATLWTQRFWFISEFDARMKNHNGAGTPSVTSSSTLTPMTVITCKLQHTIFWNLEAGNMNAISFSSARFLLNLCLS